MCVAHLACSAKKAADNVVAKGTVTPETGGTVATSDGKLSLTFPPGAVDAAVEISIVALPPDQMPSESVPGSAYDLRPSGLVFSAPVQIEQRFTLAEITAWGNALTDGGFDDGGIHIIAPAISGPDGGWEEMGDASTTVYLDGGVFSVNGSTTHFSQTACWGPGIVMWVGTKTSEIIPVYSSRSSQVLVASRLNEQFIGSGVFTVEAYDAWSLNSSLVTVDKGQDLVGTTINQTQTTRQTTPVLTCGSTSGSTSWGAMVSGVWSPMPTLISQQNWPARFRFRAFADVTCEPLTDDAGADGGADAGADAGAAQDASVTFDDFNVYPGVILWTGDGGGYFQTVDSWSDNSGGTAAVWTQNASGKYDVWAGLISTTGGGSPTTTIAPSIVSHEGYNNYFPDVIVSADGMPWVVWAEDEASRTPAFVAKRDGGAWEEATEVALDAGTVGWTGLVVANSVVHALFSYGNPAYAFESAFSSGAWGGEGAVGPGLGHSLLATGGGSGINYVSQVSSGSTRELRSASWGGSWGASTVLMSNTASAWYGTEAFVSGSDVIVVVWAPTSGTWGSGGKFGEVRIAPNGAVTAFTERLDVPSGYYDSMGAGPDGMGGFYAVASTCRSGASCTETELVAFGSSGSPASIGTAGHSSGTFVQMMARPSENLIAMAYIHKNSGIRELRTYRRNASGWVSKGALATYVEGFSIARCTSCPARQFDIVVPILAPSSPPQVKVFRGYW